MSEATTTTNPTETQPSSDRQRHELDETTVNQILYFTAIATYVLSALSNLRYNFGRRSPWDHGHQDDVGFTPFTASSVAVFLYWGITVVVQFVYLTKFFKRTPRFLNWQFLLSNLLLLSWSYLFARGHYFLSELVVLLNFLQLLAGYILIGSFRLRPLSFYLTIHGAVIALPLIWSHYLIFWNGAVLLGARNAISRLVANIVIWEFLLVPGVLLIITGDYLLGFASAWIALAIGIGQLFTKVFALQWVFAFTIATVLFVGSLSFAFVQPNDRYAPPALSELRQRANVSNETAPLLTDP